MPKKTRQRRKSGKSGKKYKRSKRLGRRRSAKNRKQPLHNKLIGLGDEEFTGYDDGGEEDNYNANGEPYFDYPGFSGGNCGCFEDGKKGDGNSGGQHRYGWGK